MQRAKALGIDALALNIGVDPYTDTQLGYAYESAANNDMKVFISFDFNWYIHLLSVLMQSPKRSAVVFSFLLM